MIGRQQLQTPDVIIGTVKVKERFMQVTSATLPHVFAFLALSFAFLALSLAFLAFSYSIRQPS